MLNDLFQNINLLQKGLDAAWMRNEVINNNIANIDTPGFKSSSVEFETAMKQALESDGNSSAARTADPRHYDFSDSNASNVTPVVVKNNGTAYRADGNNVDIDYESTELAKNTLWYNELIEQVSSEISRLKTVISG